MQLMCARCQQCGWMYMCEAVAYIVQRLQLYHEPSVYSFHYTATVSSCLGKACMQCRENLITTSPHCCLHYLVVDHN